MSLKAFHIFFILISVVLAAGCSWWAFANDLNKVFGIGSAAIAAGLFIYGIYFIKKSKRLIV